MTKTIVILTLGTRGDVQPYVALGVGLQRAGYAVRLVAPKIFANLVREQGLEFVPVPFNPQEELQKPEIQAMLRRGALVLNLGKLIRYAQELFLQIFAIFWQASQGAQLIVASSLAYGAHECAEKRGIPLVAAHLAPVSPTQAFSNFFLTAARPLGKLNRPTHLLMEQISWQSVRSAINQWRTQTLQMPPAPMFSTIYARTRANRWPILYAFSPTLIPKPQDWGEQEFVTGYWFLETTTTFQPQPHVSEFLNQGVPPIVIGFGSMGGDDSTALRQKLRQALALSEQRSIVLTGWAKNDRIVDTAHTLWLDHLPHDWLFAQAAAVVHHGGAGTTAATLRAGLPSLIVPFMLDQFGWAEVVQRQGVGLKSKQLRKLTAKQLAESIHTLVNNRAIHQRVAAFGREIAAEDGVGNAIEILQRVL